MALERLVTDKFSAGDNDCRGGSFCLSDWLLPWHLYPILVLYMVSWVVPLYRSILLFHYLASVGFNVGAKFCRVLIKLGGTVRCKF
jgi:hypothetical protein